MATEAFAPAKVNLTLHVTGRRPDGYHLLDSLVVFADAGDLLRVEAGPALSLAVTGPESAGLEDGEKNLVHRAARLFRADRPAHLTLMKRLPVAAGIGGGSADAAAALRLLSRFWDRPLPLMTDVQALGADVPVCVASQPARMQGIGEILSPAPPLPPLFAILVNPRVSLPTPAVFNALQSRDNAPMRAELPRWRTVRGFCNWLRAQRNDLQAPAIALAPVIAEVLNEISKTGSMVSRMSGSGATCFGLYETEQQAQAARVKILADHPDWWIVDTTFDPDLWPVS